MCKESSAIHNQQHAWQIRDSYATLLNSAECRFEESSNNSTTVTWLTIQEYFIAFNHHES
jgi:hypothetical protein